MKARGAMVQGALAAVGLVAAWTTWQREPDHAPGEAVVLDVTHNDLSKVRFEDEKKWVELEVRKGDGVWLHTSARLDLKLPERTLRANESAEKLLERFAPLRANRSLGALGPDKLKEFGLEAPKKKLRITARGEESTFLVGSSPFGVSDPYVKDEHDGKVYLLGGSILSDLESATTRLLDRSLHQFLPSEFDGLTVAAAGKQREFVQTHAENSSTAKLAAKATPEKADEMVKNWHDKVWRLVSTDVLGQNENPASGAPQIAARIDYTFRGKERGFIELARVIPAAPPDGPAGAPKPLTPQSEIYARTEHTAGWVKVPASNDELLHEAEKIAASE